MSDFETIEIGVVAYQSAQESAVLGLTDLLRVAGRIAASHMNSGIAPFRLTHWRMSSPFSLPGRVFDTAPSSDVALAAVILPPTLNLQLNRARHSHGLIGYVSAMPTARSWALSVQVRFFLLSQDCSVNAKRLLTGLMQSNSSNDSLMFISIRISW